MYSWTYKQWLNRIQGANLAVIDAHELAVQAAWVSGIVSRPVKGRPKGPDKYFDAKQARKQILSGGKPKKEADFTLYNRMKDGLKDFDWRGAIVPKEK
ncbi:hypothetical protein MKX47_12265 [Solibacillus sp. FSL R7-0668]|uniref:hypothetical protein n=1 Tax=Solibacillus sp. FSL R7-0668 TaxID=2921688 RepID=UPI0030F92E59